MHNDQIIGTIDPEFVEKLVERKEEIDRGSWATPGVMAALALGSVPVALAALSHDVYGQTALPTAVQNAFNFALALEIFENEFYKAVLNMSSTPAQNAAFNTVRAKVTDAAVLATLAQIQKHEAAHVATLKALGAADPFGLLGSSGNGDATKFDFTGARGAGNGPFAQATTDVDFLLLTAQGAEDTGVRAYKGQAAGIIGTGAYLEGALRIHSVEARHAARIRRIRRSRIPGDTTLRWSGTVRGGGAGAAGSITSVTPPQGAVDALNKIYGAGSDATNYPSESNTTQGGANVTGLPNTSSFNAEAFAEAFDEPLGRADVVAIVQPFFIPTIS